MNYGLGDRYMGTEFTVLKNSSLIRILDLNGKHKILAYKTGENVNNLGYTNDFLDMALKA